MSFLQWVAWNWPSEKNLAKPVALIDRMIEALVLAVLDQTRVILGPLLGYLKPCSFSMSTAVDASQGLCGDSMARRPT
jgi:hypothetical protein